MAAATVIHFGSRDLYRVPMFWNAGYEVLESDSLDRLRIALEHDDDIDAVIMSEVDPRCAELAATLVRARSSVPLILFCHPHVRIDESQFDRVFSLFYPKSFWLYETTVLVIESQKLGASASCKVYSIPIHPPR
jgi:hypothetical protein